MWVTVLLKWVLTTIFMKQTKLVFNLIVKKARGKRLDIPAGTAIRFEPGETKTVQLIDFGGKRRIFGFNNKVNGFLD